MEKVYVQKAVYLPMNQYRRLIYLMQKFSVQCELVLAGKPSRSEEMSSLLKSGGRSHVELTFLRGGVTFDPRTYCLLQTSGI